MRLTAWFGSVLDSSNLKGPRGWLTGLFALMSSCFFCYTAYAGAFTGFAQKSFLFLVCTGITFLNKPCLKSRPKAALAIDMALTLLAVATFGNVMLNYRSIAARASMVSNLDIVMGILACLLLVEATRRLIGNSMPFLVLLMVLYGWFGNYIPGIFRHRGLSLNSFITVLYTTEDGIFGMPAAGTANFIMMFIIFGAFLNISGAGTVFTRIATGLFGKTRGGTAKASIGAAALVGMISGSSVANIATTGPISIPLMKETRYTGVEAAAITAVAATGGQIMPPVMGAAAFIMANTLNVPYLAVAVAAAIPAALYYIAEFFMVDLLAAKKGITGLSEDNLPDAKKELRENWYLLVPLVVLVVLLAGVRLSAQKSAFYATAVVVLLSIFQKKGRLTPRKFLSGMIEGALGGVEIGVICGCAGIIIGIIMRSGLGLSLTGTLVELAQGKLILLLFLAMVASIIMGMGLPTAACYIISSTLIAPAMIKMGVVPMAAHMFVFYFACISSITPPVAIASYAAAGIASESPMKTGWLAVKLGIVGFVVPYMFVYGNELLLMGHPLQIAWALLTALFGIYLMSVGVIGYRNAPIALPLRLLLFLSALLLIIPGWLTDFIGAGVMAMVVLYQRRVATPTSPQKSE